MKFKNSSQRKAVMMKMKISKTYRNGYLSIVNSEEGKKPSIKIVQERDGYVARHIADNTRVGMVKTNPEKYAINLAKKGHMRVKILD